MIVLFDLVTKEDLRPSPFCWRAKLALKHKGVRFDARATLYSEIPEIGDGTFKTLPVINDGGAWSGGSLQIAVDLEARYPDGPALFPNDPRRRFAEFVESYVDTVVHPLIFPCVALHIWEQLPGSEKEYFRKTRERRLGMTLEKAHELSEPKLTAARASLDPVRRVLNERPYLCGDGPAYADYIVFGALQWQRMASDRFVIERNDALSPWFDKIDAIAQSVPSSR